MFTWIANARESSLDPPPAVSSAVAALGALEKLQVRNEGGGIRRPDVIAALSQRTLRAGFTKPDEYFDGIDQANRLGLRIEAGRAHANNEGVIALLTAAMHPDVDVLCLVVPDSYMGSDTVGKVCERLTSLLSHPGLSVNVTGVAVAAY